MMAGAHCQHGDQLAAGQVHTGKVSRVECDSLRLASLARWLGCPVAGLPGCYAE